MYLISQNKKKKKIINVIMSVFFPNTPAIFSEHVSQTLRLICSSTFFRNDANKNIATPIGDILHH